MIDFAGKVLLLTGANGGIARAIARTFVDLGAACVLSDMNEPGLRQFASELNLESGRVVTAKHDVTKSEDADALMALAKVHFGKIDFVVTGAGIYIGQTINDMTDNQWRKTIAVNLDGVFYTCRAAIPLLVEGGAIVNIASMAGHRGSFMHTHYATAKGAVLTFTRSLALELAPRIRVNSISPGLIDTPMIDQLLSERGPSLIDQTPLKRLGLPIEVARATAFLCSPWASFITGETLHVNGGLYIAS